jgi:small GTP-binding protein
MSLASSDVEEHKIVFVGDSNAGKTTIIYKYLNITQTVFPTVAALSFPIPVSLHDRVIRLSCWDTAGQESYRCLVPIYARNAEIACLVFDQSSMASFESLGGWLKYLESDVALSRVLVVSNKCDLPAAVPLEMAVEFCAAKKVPLVVTSAIAGTNICFLFQKVAEMIAEDSRRQKTPSQNIELKSDRHPECC